MDPYGLQGEMEQVPSCIATMAVRGIPRAVVQPNCLYAGLLHGTVDSGLRVESRMGADLLPSVMME